MALQTMSREVLTACYTYEVLRDDHYGAIYLRVKARNVGAIGSSFFGW